MRWSLPFILSLLSNALCAQLYWSDAISAFDGTEYGKLRPRIEYGSCGPVVLTMKNSGEFFVTTWQDDAFGTPEALHPTAAETFVSTYGGVDMAVSGDMIYVVYMTKPFQSAQLYLRKSEDCGETWTDAVHIPLPDSVIPFLPTVAITDDLNPVVLFMAYDENYADPQYALVKSSNGGTSFGDLVHVSELAPHEVCDCCPAHLSIDGAYYVALFRNNDQNIRDMWISVSENNGASFTTSSDIDPEDWFVNTCPTSGPDAYMDDNAVRAVWMSAGTGQSRVSFSKYQRATQQFTTSQLYGAGVQQTEPRLDGHGDTLGVVFQNSENSQNNVLLLYSTNGGETFSEPLDIADDSAGQQYVPDVVFHDGVFHFVYRDVFESHIQYRQASFDPLLKAGAVKERALQVYPNPGEDIITIAGTSSKTRVDVLNASGQILSHFECGNRGACELAVDDLPYGLYMLRIEDQTGVVFQRWLKK